MKITTYILLAIWCVRVRCHDEPDILRLSHRQPETVNGYKTSVVHGDNDNRKNSMSSVSMQLHLKDHNKPIPIESNNNDYVSAQEDINLRHFDHSQPRTQHQIIKQYNTPKENYIPLDSDTGASENHANARYMLPPEGYISDLKQNQNQQRYVPQQAQYTTPAPYASMQFQNKINNQYENHQNTAASQVHYVATPAPSQFTSTAGPQSFYLSSQPNHLAPQAQYLTAAEPLHYNSAESQFGNSAPASSNLQYMVTSAPRIQYQSTPSPIPQYASDQQNSRMQYVSTPAPNLQYVSTQNPHDHYVSTPVHYMSTPSPIHYSTGPSIYGNRINSNNQILQSNNMQIDHFDNAMSGVRNPKPQQQHHSNFFTTSTPSPMVISTTISPIKTPKVSDDNWRINNQNIFNNLQTFGNTQTPQSVQYHQSNFQDQSSNLNALESANYAVNVVHPGSQLRGTHRFQLNRVNHQRDLEKDTDVASTYSNGDFGWKLSPKKSSTSSQHNSVIQFPLSVLDDISEQKTLNLDSSSNTEFRINPNNPFLSHVSPLKSGSIQSISVHPDSNEQQNVNVGYSIGFGNSVLNQDKSAYANKYPFTSNVQSFTTAFPPGAQDVVKGVHVSQVNLPEPSYFLKESNNPQDYVANALKLNEKLKLNEATQFGNGLSQTYAYNIPATPYKISHTIKALDINQGNNLHLINNAPKSSNFQTVSPDILSYRGSDGKPFKWASIDIAGTQMKPLVMNIPESSTPKPMLFINNANEIVTNSPYLFATNKEGGDGRILQNFDHANALKNIQPIDISNVVSYTPTPSPNTNNPVTISPHFFNSHNLQQYAQLSPIPTGHIIQHYPQDQSHIVTGSINSPNAIEQGFYGNFKQGEQAFYKDKNLIYNVQPLKQKISSFEDFGESYALGKIPSIRQLDIGPSAYVLNGPIDMMGHSTNMDSRHMANMVYVPSDAFRRSNHGGKDFQNDKIAADHLNYLRSDRKSSNYQRNSQFSEGKFRMQNLDNEAYEDNLNQNLESHRLEPLHASSENDYRISRNERNNREEIFEYPNEVDPSTGEALTNIDGIQVANPYNVDLKIVSDMLKGKVAVDESKLEPLRKKMSRIKPIKLDTSALQSVVVQNEQPSQSSGQDHDISDSVSNRQYVNYDMRAKNRLKNTYKQKNYNVDYSESPRPFQNDFTSEDEAKFQQGVPNIASEQLQNSVQSILSAHEIGAVMESPRKGKNRNKEVPLSVEVNEGFEGSDFSDRDHRPSALASEDVQHKHPKQDVNEPYPLLKPPRLPNSLRSNKKSEKRPYGARHNRHLGHRHRRPSKIQQDIEEFEDYDGSYRIQTELRPPPAELKRKSG